MKRRCLAVYLVLCLLLTIIGGAACAGNSTGDASSTGMTTGDASSSETTAGAGSTGSGSAASETVNSAEGQNKTYELYYIQVEAGNAERTEVALQDSDGFWYMTAETIEKYTGYHYDEEDSVWKKYADTETSDKKIWVYAENCQVNVKMLSTDYMFHATALPCYNGAQWFPIHQFLPLMETVCEVEDGVLKLSGLAVTMEDALHNLNLESLVFDVETAYNGHAWAQDVQYSLAFVWDTLTDGRWDRLTLAGSYNDYKKVFVDYLTDRDAWETASEMSAEDLKSLGRISGYLGDWISLEEDGGFMIKTLTYLEGMYESLGLADEFYSVIDRDFMEYLGGVGDALEMGGKYTTCLKNYTLMVGDNRNMLTSVFPEILGSDAEPSFLASLTGWLTMSDAAYYVYTLYGETSLTDLYVGMAKSVAVDTVSEKFLESAVASALVIPVWYLAAAEVTGKLIDSRLADAGIEDTEELALFDAHLDVLASAYNTCTAAYEGTCTQENLETLRLSAIMTLLSSKKCFEILRSTDMTNEENVTYCDAHINNITESLALLYLANESILVDGVEYFQAATKELETSLAGLNASQTEEHPELSVWADYYASLVLSDVYRDYYVYMADLTGNGVWEMILAKYCDDPEAGECAVYTLQDQTPTEIYWTVMTTGEYGTDLLSLATNQEGKTGLLFVFDDAWRSLQADTGYCDGYEFLMFSENGVSDTESGASGSGDGTYESGYESYLMEDCLYSELWLWESPTTEERETFDEERWEQIGTKYEIQEILLNGGYDGYVEGTTNIFDYGGYLSALENSALQVKLALEEYGYTGVSVQYSEEEKRYTVSTLESEAAAFEMYVDEESGAVHLYVEEAWEHELFNLENFLKKDVQTASLLSESEAESALREMGYTDNMETFENYDCGNTLEVLMYDYTYLTEEVTVDRVSGVAKVTFQGMDVEGYLDLRSKTVLSGDPLPKEKETAEAVYDEPLSQETVEAALSEILGEEFYGYTLYQETGETFTYLNLEDTWQNMWFITVYRLSGQVEYCNARGVVLEEYWIGE